MLTKHTLIALALAGIIGAPAQAVTMTFAGGSNGRWDFGTNWDPDAFPWISGSYGTPDFGDTVKFKPTNTAVIYKGMVGEASRVELNNNSTLRLDRNTAPGEIDEKSWGTLTVKYQAGDPTSGALVVGYKGTDGTLRSDFGLVDVKTLYLGYENGVTGSFSLGNDYDSCGYCFGTLKAQTVYVGVSGTGRFIQDDPRSKTVIQGDLTVGQASTSTSSIFRLYDGTVSADNQIIGKGGYGKFDQHEGEGLVANKVSNLLVLGNDAGSRGEYLLRGGALSSGNQQIGQTGVGYFEQIGGTNTTGSLYLGLQAASTGNAYVLKDGALSAIDEYIGSQGAGSFTQTGGSNTATGTVSIGHATGSTGSYSLGKGTLEARALRVGNQGQGTFTQDGGTSKIADALYVGTSNKDARGGNIFSDYELKSGALSSDRQIIGYAGAGRMTQTGGSNTIGSYFSVGSGNATAVGIYVLSGGSLSAPKEDIGGSGVAGFFAQQDGTTHTVASTLTLGSRSGSTGLYYLNGGTLRAGSERIGAQGQGIFRQKGGTNTVAAGLTVVDNGSSYSLSEGTLKAATITAKDETAFNFMGGTLSVQTFIGTLVNNGGTLSPGASPGSTHVMGDYLQSATGSMIIELGGTAPGLFDAVNVDGTASLAGLLGVSFWNGFRATAGDSFDILSASTLQGSFDTLQLASLAPGLSWQVAYRLDPVGIDTLNLSVVAVPEPETYALFLAGLGVVGWVARRRKG